MYLEIHLDYVKQISVKKYGITIPLYSVVPVSKVYWFFCAAVVCTIKEPVLVVGGEAVDYNGDGEGEDEDPQEGAQSSRQLPREGGGVELIAHSSQGHHGVPMFHGIQHVLWMLKSLNLTAQCSNQIIPLFCLNGIHRSFINKYMLKDF